MDLVEALHLPEFSIKQSQSSVETAAESRRDRARCTLVQFRRTSPILQGLTRQLHKGYLIYIIKTTAELNECIDKKQSFDGETYSSVCSTGCFSALAHLVNTLACTRHACMHTRTRACAHRERLLFHHLQFNHMFVCSFQVQTCTPRGSCWAAGRRKRCATSAPPLLGVAEQRSRRGGGSSHLPRHCP